MIKKIYIQGMHCVSCERLLEDEFGNIPNVKSVKVNRQENWAELRYVEEEPSFSEIKRIAEKFGYKAYLEKPISSEAAQGKKLTQWIEALIIVFLLFLVYKIFQNLGVIDKINISSTHITFGISFLIGLVASISSCLAVVGAVIIAFSEKYKSQGDGFYQKTLRPNLLFHIGRIVTFFVLGGVLGLIGGEMNLSGNFISIFTFIIAIVMAILGLNILGLFPSISQLGLSMPKKLSGNWSALKNSNHKFAPFVLGGLSFFLPCGFTQSMQIFALSSGSFLIGGLSLLLFALGTVPMLLILGVTTSWTKKKGLIVFQKVAGIIITLFSVYTFNSALALRGINLHFPNSQKQNNISANSNFQVQSDKITAEQTITMHVTNRGFEPNTFTLKKGVPVKWVVEGDQVSGCTSKIIIPSLNISKSLTSGENIIQFTPNKTGNIPFSCWMGMVRGNFIVE